MRKEITVMRNSGVEIDIHIDRIESKEPGQFEGTSIITMFSGIKHCIDMSLDELRMVINESENKACVCCDCDC